MTCAPARRGLSSRMRRLFAFWVPSAILLSAPLARACPGCIESVKVASGHSNDILSGFSLSVLFMLGAVLIVVGGLTSLVVKTVREIEAARARELIPVPIEAPNRRADR